MIMRRTWGAIAASLVLIGCGNSGSGAPKVDAALGDFNVKLSTSSSKAGTVRIHANNSGGVEHEIVVVKMALQDLPLKADGSVDEDQIAEDLKQGEIEHVAARTAKDGSFDLQPGTYSVFCNLETKQGDGTMLLHYPKGMKAELVVS
jgi:uncharacterized cupredoxin-like copper-binding protein